MTNTLIKICKVKKNYGSHKVLENIDFQIDEGFTYGLLGINGAGKSSFMQLLASLHAPSSGEIYWNNKSIASQITDYRRFIGYCPQEQTLETNLTIKQILQFQGRYYGLNKKQSNRKAEQLIEDFDLQDYTDTFPFVLSGGSKQRFMIAKTLMHSPKFLILDEPSVGLDIIARDNLWKKLLDLKQQGVTLLFSTHYLQEVENYADHLLILHQGKLEGVKTVKSLQGNLKETHFESALAQLLSGETI